MPAATRAANRVLGSTDVNAGAGRSPRCPGTGGMTLFSAARGPASTPGVDGSPSPRLRRRARARSALRPSRSSATSRSRRSIRAREAVGRRRSGPGRRGSERPGAGAAGRGAASPSARRRPRAAARSAPRAGPGGARRRATSSRPISRSSVPSSSAASVEAVQALGARAQLAGRLRAAQHQHRQQRELGIVQPERPVERVPVLHRAPVGPARERRPLALRRAGRARRG